MGARKITVAVIQEPPVWLDLAASLEKAVALAEHLGAGLDGDATPRARGADRPATGTDPVASFVRAMNDKATSLGMRHTRFTNPHGLSDPRHVTSAHDLFRLACAVRKDPRLRRIVATRRHTARITGAHGTKREEVWHNTNRLLAWQGYDGMKTGTTSAAGACLVASGEREGHARIVVLLGASGDRARWADARNLFRYAWALPAPAPSRSTGRHPSPAPSPVAP